MRLYRTDAGAWHGTQDVARSDAGKAWETVAVPTDKPGLIAWLNAQAAPTAIVAPVEAQPEPVEAPSVPSVAIKAADPAKARNAHNIRVEDEIAAADLPTVIRLHNHVLWRLAEFVRAVA